MTGTRQGGTHLVSDYIDGEEEEEYDQDVDKDKLVELMEDRFDHV